MRAIDVRLHRADGGVDVADGDADQPHAKHSFISCSTLATSPSEATSGHGVGARARARAAPAAAPRSARAHRRAPRRAPSAAATGARPRHTGCSSVRPFDATGFVGERDQIVIGEAVHLQLARAASPCRCRAPASSSACRSRSPSAWRPRRCRSAASGEQMMFSPTPKPSATVELGDAKLVEPVGDEDLGVRRAELVEELSRPRHRLRRDVGVEPHAGQLAAGGRDRVANPVARCRRCRRA